MSTSDRIRVTIDGELEDLVPGFLANRSRDILAIREAMKSGDQATAQRLGHSMKGAGGGYGFDRITEIGARIEEAARDGDVAGVNSALKDLADYLERVEVEFE